MKKQRLIKLGLLVLILGDLCLSWFQYVHRPIDGDLYAIVLPAPWYEEVLEDPLCLKALLAGEEYGGAGRYSAHAFTSGYFHIMPDIFQTFVSPIDSIYYSAAFIKLAAHLSLLLLLAAYVCGHFKVLRKEFLWIMVAATPFLQTYGMQNRFGLIDLSITYTLFYIFPLLLIFALLFSLYQYAIGRRQLGVPFSLGIWTMPWLAAIGYIAFWGPQSQVVMVLIGGLGLLNMGLAGWIRHRSWREGIAYLFRPSRSQLSLLLIGLILFAGFGYWAGTYNTENVASLPFKETLIQSAKGIKFHFLEPWPLWIVLFFLCYNFYKLPFARSTSLRSWRRLWFFLALGVVIYMLLIPFGGYRSYRPLIYRYDLLIPVTISWLYALLLTGRLLLQEGVLGSKKGVYFLIAALFGVILYAHDLKVKKANKCEKSHLVTLQTSSVDTLVLPADCPILGWEPDDNSFFTEKR